MEYTMVGKRGTWKAAHDGRRLVAMTLAAHNPEQDQVVGFTSEAIDWYREHKGISTIGQMMDFLER